MRPVVGYRAMFAMVVWTGAGLLSSAAGPVVTAAEIDFAHQIAPVLREHCGMCHIGDQKKGGLSLNSLATLLAGGESGKSVVSGKSDQSDLFARLTSNDPDLRMPPEGPRLSAAKVALIKEWIDAGLPWEDGFTFGKRGYEPPLKPRRPELPAATAGREHPIDRIIDAYLAVRKAPPPAPVEDAVFVRRVYLDLIGLLPTPGELQSFLTDRSPDKRERLVRELLSRDVDYAEHWLSFWNDLLRNDYTGTGFITGGRKQISKWLYAALVSNKPYDQLARELIAPATPESRGFIDGIRWRGEVSAGQTVEIQFAQSVGQSFLGINLKCASCHDSFVDRWKLDEAYGLAAVYASQPLELHRCDLPTGKKAVPAWLFPELGKIDPKLPQPERLKQLAGLLTHAENGRFTRTIVNRLWLRMLGHGIVHPVDAMQNEPWNTDLLDYLAVHLVDHQYDLKKTLELIATSQAYQSQTQVVARGADDQGYVFAGPRPRRLTAEQFMDAVWQLTGESPRKFDAPLARGKTDPKAAQTLAGKWVWAYADVAQSPANETIVFRKKFPLAEAPIEALAAITCDNSYVLYVNGQRAHAGDNWEVPDAVPLTSRLKAGPNGIVIVAKNGGAGPNPAGLFFEARVRMPAGETTLALGTDWEWTKTLPDSNGRFKTEPADWQAAVPVQQPEVWAGRVGGKLATLLNQTADSGGRMVRASLVKNDALMSSLGRPNRDQIVTVRPVELSMLEAINLSNGHILSDTLSKGSRRLLARKWESPEPFVEWLFRFALSRSPSESERAILSERLGPKLSEQGIEDALWAVLMLPEFQLVR